jgi:hypothetical protein
VSETPYRPPAREDLAEEKRRLLELLSDLEGIGSPGEVQERDPFEFPERPGL